ncbi:MAG TPA: GNAT family N-acetyltransferase [Stellaceae bacterium]|nr:GNAT family N-acetyltransferase [Stellaceae bacterium]
MTGGVIVRPMKAGDLPEATRIFRTAFATFLGVPDVTQFRRDLGTIETRFKTDAGAALVAGRDGRLVGSVFGMDWGGQFVVGPLTVDPACWKQGVARLLTTAILAVAERRKSTLVSLFTFPHSATHLRLYQSFGFAPMFLTPVMEKPVAKATSSFAARLFSRLGSTEQAATLAMSLTLTGSSFPGLDLRREIGAIAAHRLGETILLDGAEGLAGIALCHIGAGTEAGEGALFVKFAAVRPGATADFERLLDAIEALAVARGVERITAGVNTGRRDAHRRMLERGFRAGFVGVAMHRPDIAGTLRPDLYIIDDWR